MAIYFEPMIDSMLKRLAAAYYFPFIGMGYGANIGAHEFTIRHQVDIVGFIDVDPACENGLTICILPMHRGKGFGEKAIKKLFSATHISRLSYIVRSDNYPSLKLLEKAGGGLLPGTIHTGALPGYLDIKNKTPDEDRCRLSNAIATAKNLFVPFDKQQQGRHDILDNLIKLLEVKKFLLGYVAPSRL